MASLGERERRAAIAELEELASQQAEPIRLSYTTEVYVYRRR